MLRLAADENFNNGIVRGVRRRDPAIDIVRIQDAGLSAAQNGRVLLTHDVATMTRYAYDRVREGKPMPGVFEVGRYVPIGVAIDEIVLLAECSLDQEWEGQLRYLPLR
jgi:hypothetical protein